MIKLASKLKHILIIGTALLTLTLSASAIEMKIGIGTVNTSGGLNLRETASSESASVAVAAGGHKVVVIRETDDWYLVDYNLKVGYMKKEYLDFDPVKNIELGEGLAEENTVNVRSTPSADGEVLAKIPQGSTGHIIGFNNGWYKLEYNGVTGYVRSDLLALTEEYNDGTSAPSTADSIVTFAKQFLGTPYVWGGTKPSGFDCSGYTKYVANNFGVTVNRTAAQQLNNGAAVSYDDLQVGDFVFFGRTYSSSAAATHVGIYIGDGNFIHAANGGVKITALSDDYYASRYVGARRIF